MCVKDRQPDVCEVVNRFTNYIEEDPDTGCWQWTGGKSRGGQRFSSRAIYGTFNPGGVVTGGVRAHVYIAWLTGIVPRTLPMRVPAGMNLDHKCENALCVNPAHLELVEAGENQRRRIEGRKGDLGIPVSDHVFLLPFSEGDHILWLY